MKWRIELWFWRDRGKQREVKGDDDGDRDEEMRRGILMENDVY